jgi:hypothetical protein
LGRKISIDRSNVKTGENAMTTEQKIINHLESIETPEEVIQSILTDNNLEEMKSFLTTCNTEELVDYLVSQGVVDHQ